MILSESNIYIREIERSLLFQQFEMDLYRFRIIHSIATNLTYDDLLNIIHFDST